MNFFYLKQNKKIDELPISKTPAQALSAKDYLSQVVPVLSEGLHALTVERFFHLIYPTEVATF
jgi:hypothetical protein